MSDINEIRAALSYVDPHEREMWIKMGTAVKDELGNEGFDLWDRWSQQTDNYNARAAKDVWKSLKPGNVRIGSLFYEARQAGYQPSKPYTPPTAEEQARREREAQQRQQAEAAATQKAQEKAQRTARSLWQKNPQASPNHPYLVAKGITDPYIIGQLRQSHYKGQDNLLIPVMQDKEIVSMQFIGEDGSKRFLSGGKTQGSYTFIGDAKRMSKGVVMAEGMATGASIYQATGIPVVVAFNAGNLPAVAEKLVQSLPADVPVIIAADNDVSQTGISKAQQAAAVFGERARVVMPSFTEAQQIRYQAQHGQDALPSDFNDLQQLAGLDAVRQTIGLTYQVETAKPEQETTPEPIISQEMRPEEIEPEWPKPDRTPWGDFPPVIRNGGLGELKNEPEYQAAKGGDPQAAIQLVQKLIKPELVQQIFDLADGEKACLVPVLAQEAAGNNMIPLAMANALSEELGFSVEYNIQQATKVSRTGSGIYHRLTFQPTFTGDVDQNQKYIIIDDSLSVGGTIASLKGHIENRGGQVLGAAVMTAHEGALNIVIQSDRIQAIRQKHGDSMDNLLKQELGYGVEKLTQGESGHIRKAASVDFVRDRLIEARNVASINNHEAILHKAISVQKEQPGITPTPEATQPVASGLSEPPPSTPSPTAADQAAFLRPQETNMAKANEHNTIELDDQRQQTISLPEPEQPAESAAPKPSATTARPAADNSMPDPEPTGKDKTVTPEPEPSADTAQPKQPNQPITDLQYKAPPEQLANRYIVAGGQYLSAENGTTVLFEDKGKKISTARTDAQTVSDMLEVAKAKGWDSIKLSGTKEFKAMMYVAAESQGIRTRGYAPTPADLALVEKLRTDRSLNSIEPARPQQEHQQNPNDARPATATASPATQAGERIVAHGAAPYQHDPKNQSSYYLTLEKNGRERTIWGAGLPEALTQSGAQTGDRIDLKNLGKQPVTIQTPVRDKEGKVVGHEEKETNRNVFRIAILERAVEPDITKQPEPSAEQSTPTQIQAQPQSQPSENNSQESSKPLAKEPDKELLAAADRVEAAGMRVNDVPVDTSSGADTEIPASTTDRERIPAEAQHIAGEMRGAAHQNTALDMSLQTARDNYHTKASKLSKTAKAKLVFYERNTLDAIRGLEGDFRKEALRNFYDQTAQEMHGSKLVQPHPIQVPDPVQNHTARPNAEHRPTQETEPSRGDDQEIDR